MRRLALTTLALLLAVCASASAAPVRLRPAWHRGAAATHLVADGRYAFTLAPGGTRGELIDTATGRRTAVSVPAGCLPETIGGDLILFGCPLPAPYALGLPVLHTYAIAHAAPWAPLTPNPTVAGECGGGLGDACGAIAIGTDWVEFDVFDCDATGLSEHCPGMQEFQSLRTGVLAPDPRAGGHWFDLDTPGLSYRLCSPVQQPSADVGDGPVLLPFERIGQVFVAEIDYGTVLRISRCGGPALSVHLGTATPLALPTGTDRALLWQQYGLTLAGIRLPSGRRFTLASPPRGRITAADLVGKTIFTLAGGQLWTARLPP